jgi:hypothetical protein
LHPHAECYLWRPSDITFIAQRLSQCWYWLGMPC